MAFCSVTLWLSIDQFDSVLYRSSEVLFYAVLWCLVMARQGMAVFSNGMARHGGVQ